MAQKIGIRSPQASLREGELNMLVHALEECPHCLDLNSRVGVEDDHIVEAGCHLIQALYNVVDNLDQPPGRRAASLGHDVPLIEARGSAKCRERNGIIVRGNMMERRNQVEQGKHSFLAQRVQDLVHAGEGQLAEAAELVEFLVADSDPNTSRLLQDDHQRARIRRGRVLDEACREVMVQGGANFLSQNSVDPVGPGSDMCSTFRDRNLERHQGGTQICLGLRGNVSKTAKNIALLFDCYWGPVRAVKVKCNRAQMWQQSFLDAQERSALFRANT